MSMLALLCRFCAKEQSQQSIIDLKTNEIYRHSVMKKLSLFNEEFLDFNNKCLPETVCTTCYSILNTSYDFFMRVQESQVVLIRLCSNVELVEARLRKGPAKHEFYVLENDSVEKDIKPVSNSSDAEITPSWCTYPWRCTFCNAILPSMQAVREHSQEIHGTCCAFQCADCNEKTNGFMEFVDHVKMKRRELVKYCEYCNIKMENSAHMDIHLAGHHCTYCGQMFTEKSSLYSHLNKYVTKSIRLLRSDAALCKDNTDHKVYETIYPIDTKSIMNDKLDILNDNTTYCDDTVYCDDTTYLNDKTYINDSSHGIDDKTDKTNEAKYMNRMNDTTNRISDTYKTNHTTDVMDNKKNTNTKNKINIDDIEIQSWSQYPHICKFCNIKVAYADMLKEHCMVTHKRCFGMKCTDCDYNGADTFEMFVQHVTEHRPYLKNICQYCDRETSNLEKHIKTHIGRYQCTICSENFTTSGELRRHNNKLETPAFRPPARRKGPITDKDLTCTVCGKRMKTPLSLRAHKIIHTVRKRNHTCDRCGKAFYTKASMEAHHKIHEDLQETCKICNKSFLTVQRLRKHVKTHNLEMPFQCHDCNKLFSSKDSLRAHVTVHMNIKPYVCQYCLKKFRNKHTMKTHENQHTGARPYSCDVCCINFACWSNCDKHMRRIHGTPLAKTVKTPHGKLPIDPETGKPSEVRMTSVVKEWGRNILEKSPRKYKRKADPSLELE